MTKRRKARKIKIGNVPVGGLSPVSIQSMTNTDTRNAEATIAQIRELAFHGCEIIRVAVPDMKAIETLPEIIDGSPIPLIADIHFDWRLALASINAGVHGIRINPGNIGGKDKVKKIAEAAGNANIPIRVGANTGSLPKGFYEKLLKKYSSAENALSEALVQSALEQCGALENFGFRKIKVSLKASDVPVTVAAYRKFASRTDYPLHLGVTEAGTYKTGIVKSAVGIGSLLLDGIGDTIRVSLTAPPLEEVKAAQSILEAAGLRKTMPEIVSCPTCGRTEIDLFKLVDDVEKLISSLKAEGRKINIGKIAVMGCVVNGPGEARDAELGITGGKGKIILFKNGKASGTFSEKQGFEMLRREILKKSS
ncbi:MAG: 4-hydroxy-3-methylbut-2-en-1-yl diphosphate synthase [Lentisphaerae bacterium GWF2_44_16]|nr:MAG: 4-hydroxy-3-methylbut-2-en-1-yl diphosphate synthase [Lentisphaerae bacterium GWF2_44_16]